LFFKRRALPREDIIMRFQHGNSGRPKGARNKATIAAEALLDGEAEGLTRKAIDAALAGDVAALRICLDRILPARKSRPVSLDLPEIDGPADLMTALYQVIDSVSTGELTPDEGQAVANLLEYGSKGQEGIELEARIKKLEEQFRTGGQGDPEDK
jgi:hypothetical protein